MVDWKDLQPVVDFWVEFILFVLISCVGIGVLAIMAAVVYHVVKVC